MYKKRKKKVPRKFVPYQLEREVIEQSLLKKHPKKKVKEIMKVWDNVLDPPPTVTNRKAVRQECSNTLKLENFAPKDTSETERSIKHLMGIEKHPATESDHFDEAKALEAINNGFKVLFRQYVEAKLKAYLSGEYVPFPDMK